MEDLYQIDHILSDIQIIAESYERVSEAKGEKFNIFSILQMESNEVATHSRFISELLNPEGRHGQKDSFLKKFVEIIEIKKISTEKSRAYVEYYIGNIGNNNESGGRIDILIESPDGEIIMIENKIYAKEKKNQLLRYHNKFPQGTLIYLTLFGEKSIDKSSESIPYKIISYEHDIINWLDECRKIAVNIPILRESISQYLNLIMKLTNQNLNKKMSQDIVNRVLRDENSFNSFKTLINARNEMLKTIISENLIMVVKNISEEENLKLILNEESLLNNSEKWIGFSFTNEKLSKKNVKISFHFNVPKGYKDLIYGFSYQDSEIKGNFNYDSLKNNFKTIFGSYIETPSWPCWETFHNYSNWEDLNTLQLIRYGDFNKELRQKVRLLLEIIDNI
jgi:hypothetical protein